MKVRSRRALFLGCIPILIASVFGAGPMHAAEPANPIVEIGLTPAADLSLLPAAMLEPEGTTRWDLTGFRPASGWTRRLAREGGTVTWTG